jgi:hypothetical protein
MWSENTIEECVSMAVIEGSCQGLMMFRNDLARYTEEFPTHARQIREEFLELIKSDLDSGTLEAWRNHLLD